MLFRSQFVLGDDASVLLTATGSGHDTFVDAVRRARRSARFPALTIAEGEPTASFVMRRADGITDVHLFGDTLVLEWSAPADQVLGFEHAPRTAAERERLDGEIESLKDKREQMPADAYLDQLQKLLLQLADVQGKIDAAQGKTQ